MKEKPAYCNESNLVNGLQIQPNFKVWDFLHATNRYIWYCVDEETREMVTRLYHVHGDNELHLISEHRQPLKGMR